MPRSSRFSYTSRSELVCPRFRGVIPPCYASLSGRIEKRRDDPRYLVCRSLSCGKQRKLEEGKRQGMVIVGIAGCDCRSYL